MAIESVRTKTLKSGLRVRAAKHGETREQQNAWQSKLAQRGIPSTVFPSQAMLDDFCATVKAYEKREALRDRLERQYRAGELVLKAR